MIQGIMDGVEKFRRAFKLPISESVQLPEQNIRDLNIKLIREEFDEYIEAEKDNDIVEIADALGDMIYLICGAALSYGIPLDAVLAEIQRSNMTKLDDNGKPIYREDGKVMKSNNFEEPNIPQILYNT